MGEYISAVCLPGYRLEGTHIRRRCLGSNSTDQWSGVEPRCIRGKQIICPLLMTYTAVLIVCEPYANPTDPCMSPVADLINNLVEFKCSDSCSTSCQTTYLRCNHTSLQFEVVDFSPCVPGTVQFYTICHKL